MKLFFRMMRNIGRFVFFKFCMYLRGRLTVGHEPLELGMKVRFLPPQFESYFVIINAPMEKLPQKIIYPSQLEHAPSAEGAPVEVFGSRTS